MKLSVFAIIVLYNPHVPTLVRLLNSVKHQVDHIILADNSTCFNIKEQLLKALNDISDLSTYINLNDNMGIATAQNKGIKLAIDKNASHILLLDQDSALPNNMVSDLMIVYTSLIKDGHKVATVGPSFLDEKTNEIANIIRHHKLKVKRKLPDTTKKTEVADYIISSGSLIPVEIFNTIGVMNEDLFIDWVDIEWCIRAKQYGYNCYVAPQIIMRHCIGDGFVNVRGRKTNLHTDFRNYFIVRNSIYLSLYSQLPLNFKLIQLGKVPLYILFYSYHSKRRLYSFGLLSKAVTDGIFKNMGKGHFK